MMNQDETKQNALVAKFEAKMQWGQALKYVADCHLLQKIIHKVFSDEERQSMLMELEDCLNGPMTASMEKHMKSGLDHVGKPERLTETKALFEETKQAEIKRYRRVFSGISLWEDPAE